MLTCNNELDSFDGHKPHGGPGDGCTDSFGIAGTLLRRLHRGFDALGGDQPYVRGKGQQCAAREALPGHYVLGIIEADAVKHEFGNIDPVLCPHIYSTDLNGLRLLAEWHEVKPERSAYP